MSEGGIENIVTLNWKAAIDENLLNMSRMLEDIDYLQMQSQLSFESGSSAGRSLQGYWFPAVSWHQVEQSSLRSNLPWRQMVVLCWFCCGQVWSFSSSSTPWRPENIFSQKQFGFWRFSYFRFSCFFPCPGFEMPPHLSSLEPRVPWWRQRQLK